MKIKILILLFIQTIFILFFWYFVTAFCHVYSNTQSSWLLDTFLSILSRFIIELISADFFLFDSVKDILFFLLKFSLGIVVFSAGGLCDAFPEKTFVFFGIASVFPLKSNSLFWLVFLGVFDKL